MSSSSITHEHIFIGPGLTPFKRIVTLLGVLGLVALVLWIAVYQNATRSDASVIGSSIAAIVFIAGFLYYLKLVAPVPFTITVGVDRLVKRTSKGEEIALPWEELTSVKEEFFHNGKRISVTVYRNVTVAGQKPKAWAVYRDDVTDLDGLAATLKEAIPATCQWRSEKVHD